SSDVCFFFQAEDGIRDFHVTGVQTCALPIYSEMEAMFARMRALVGGGGRAAMVVPGHGTVTRILERLSEAEVPATAAQPGAEPEIGRASCRARVKETTGHVTRSVKRRI